MVSSNKLSKLTSCVIFTIYQLFIIRLHRNIKKCSTWIFYTLMFYTTSIEVWYRKLYLPSIYQSFNISLILLSLINHSLCLYSSIYKEEYVDFLYSRFHIYIFKWIKTWLGFIPILYHMRCMLVYVIFFVLVMLNSYHL
jgi:hypothetical protein